MSRMRDLPIKRKLTRVILLTCSAVLLLACGLLVTYEIFDFGHIMARDMSVLADVLATNTRAALAFEDEAAAQETLAALQAEPDVIVACLYGADGSVFATYFRQGHPARAPDRIGPDGSQFDNGRLTIFRPVILNDKRIGTIYIQAGLGGIYRRLKLFGGIACLVLAVAFGVAFALSSRLQRPISQPILALAETARAIAVRKDYTVRAVRQDNDETGMLTDAFNQMLTGIEERENALKAANRSLTSEVAERKNAENRVQSQLARLELLNHITRAISERLDLQSIFQVIIGSIEEHLPLDFTCVCLHDSKAGVLIVTSIGSRSAPLALELELGKKSQIPIDQNGLSRCVSGQLIYEPDIGHSEFSFPRRLAQGGLCSLVLAPLLVEKNVFGVLVAARRQPGSFGSGECEFLQQLSEHAALAAHQTQLHTELQQAYDDLRLTQQAVMQQERLRALGQMASGIAHDINNAISPAALYTESLLENEPSLTPRARNYLGTIQHAIEDVAQTVARMREFYRQRESQLPLAPVQINRIVRQVADLSRARWSDMPQQRGVVIKLVAELADDLPFALGIESEIREALINLIFNAVDAMPEGGVLTLRTRLAENDASPESEAAPQRVEVEVSDTGVGMDEDTRRRCLEPFFTTKGERGTGLGLAMVYGVAQRHGAGLEIESAAGKGTTVRLSFALPAAPMAESAAPAPSSEPAPRQRVLIVDDDPLLIKSLRDTLENDQHIVATAGGGQAGIDAFQAALDRKEPFSAVITDLGMPYVDGRKVAEAVKRASPSTRVVLLTGWGQRLVIEGDVPAHVDLVLSKPPKLRELREALAQCKPAEAV